MTTIATATAASQLSSHFSFAMYALLHELKSFVYAYPRLHDDKLPEHEIVWETTVDGGPDQAVLSAILAEPDLWRAALPDSVVVIPRKTLLSVGLSSDVIDALAMMGENEIANAAARHRASMEACLMRRGKKPIA